jgi:hypothetical protein
MIGLLGLAAVAPTVPALAGPQVLSTAPAMHIYPAQQTLYCDIVNVGTKSPQVTIEIVDYYGNVTSGPLTQTLPPGNGTALGESTANSGAYCRFTVVGASKKDMRGVGVYDNNTSYQMAIPAQ